MLYALCFMLYALSLKRNLQNKNAFEATQKKQPRKTRAVWDIGLWTI
jgi:hypothetical protein